MSKVTHWELCKKLKFDLANNLYALPKICPREWDAQTPFGFWDTNRSPYLSQITRSCNSQQKKKRTCRIVDFPVPADHKVKLKESKKKNKYVDAAKELKKLWNMKVTVIPIVIYALGSVTKGLVQEVENLEITRWVETIKTTALLGSAKTLRRVLETWGDLLSLKLQWETIS